MDARSVYVRDVRRLRQTTKRTKPLSEPYAHRRPQHCAHELPRHLGPRPERLNEMRLVSPVAVYADVAVSAGMAASPVSLPVAWEGGANTIMWTVSIKLISYGRE